MGSVDNINHPSHYCTGKIEVIEFIEDQKFDYCLGNAVKYIARCRHKGNLIEDIDKAIWYLNRFKGAQASVRAIDCRDNRRGTEKIEKSSKKEASESTSIKEYAASKGDRV